MSATRSNPRILIVTPEVTYLPDNMGNGFLFKDFDSNGLSWAIDEAIKFYNLNLKIKKTQIERIMTQSAATFSHAVTARQYIDLYEKMLARPLIKEDTIGP